jgi:hypothetical protein
MPLSLRCIFSCAFRPRPPHVPYPLLSAHDATLTRTWPPCLRRCVPLLLPRAHEKWRALGRIQGQMSAALSGVLSAAQRWTMKRMILSRCAV